MNNAFLASFALFLEVNIMYWKFDDEDDENNDEDQWS